MRRISERFDFEREFARKGEFIDFEVPRPIEIIPPDAIYTSPGPILDPVVLPKPPPPIDLSGMIGWPPPKLPTLPEYAITPKPIGKAYPLTGLEVKGPTLPPGKNFLDRFFDWMNKILSGK